MAIMEHQPQGSDELELQVGDSLKLTGNRWNGFSQGHNYRTGKSGIFPEYKTRDEPTVVDFSA